MSTSTLSLPHIIRKSTLTENAPLLIMLHGYGSDEADLYSFSGELPDDVFIISVQAPIAMQPYGNAWYSINFDEDKGKWSDNEQAKASRDLIAKFIDEAVEAYPVNKNNVTLLGFSQGTILSYAVALSYPEKVKNIIALSGYINENILLENYREKDFGNLNIYASHGSADQVIPVSWARNSPKILKELGVEHIYEEFPVGHGVAPQNFHSFNTWLRNRT